MKQKMVIRVPTNDAKDRTRAMKIAVGVPGCLSASTDGADKIVVIGDGMDPVVLTKALRKKFGGGELITVGPVDDNKKDQKKPEEKKDEKKPAPVDDKKKDQKKPEEKKDEKKPAPIDDEKEDQEKSEEKKDGKKPADSKKPTLQGK